MRTVVSVKNQPGRLLEGRARYFRVLGDPTRLHMLEALLERDLSVSQLVALTGAPQSRVSNHLACLKWCGLVTSQRQGRQMIYRVVDPRVSEMLELSHTLSVEQCDHLVGCGRIGPDWV